MYEDWFDLEDNNLRDAYEAARRLVAGDY